VGHEDPSPELLAEWLDWSLADPSHLEAFEQVKTLSMGLGALDTERKQRLLGQLHPAAVVIAPQIQRRRHGLNYAWAAGLALALVATGAWLINKPQTVQATYATGRGENRAFELPDGSRVELGAESRLNVNYVGTTRAVELLEGEAYFSVRHDARRPFVAHIGAIRLTDLGTSFDIRRTEAQVVVTVSEGVLDARRELPTLRSPDAPSPTVEASRLTAGAQLTSDSPDHPWVVAMVDPSNAASWRSGKLSFLNEPLSVVIAETNRYAKREVIIVDPAISAMRFTGTVFEDRVDDWVRATVNLFELRSESTADGKLLLYVKAARAVPAQP
jgi:transmembrane sensor